MSPTLRPPAADRRRPGNWFGTVTSAAVLVLLHLAAVYLPVLAYAAGRFDPWERDVAAYSGIPAGLALVATTVSVLLTWAGVGVRWLRRWWYAPPAVLATAAFLRLTLLAPGVRRRSVDLPVPGSALRVSGPRHPAARAWPRSGRATHHTVHPIEGLRNDRSRHAHRPASLRRGRRASCPRSRPRVARSQTPVPAALPRSSAGQAGGRRDGVPRPALGFTRAGPGAARCCPRTERRGTGQPLKPEVHMNEHEARETEPREGYAAPQLVELGAVPAVTLGRYAEDSQDQGRYFE